MCVRVPQAEHLDGYFYIITNRDGARNFKLVRAPVASPAAGSWVDVLAHRPTVKIDRLVVFRTFLALDGRSNGLARTWVSTLEDLLARGCDALQPIAAPDPVFTMWCETNRDFNAVGLRFAYTSPTCPMRTVAHDCHSGISVVLKQKVVPNVVPSKCVCAQSGGGVMGRDGGGWLVRLHTYILTGTAAR